MEVQMGTEFDIQKAQSYVRNYARTMAGTLKIECAAFVQKKSAEEVARVLGSAIYWQRIRSFVGSESFETMGKLIAGGVADTSTEYEKSLSVPMKEVHGSDNWIPPGLSGKDLDPLIATTAVAAAVAFNIWKELEKERARRADFEHTSPFRDETKAFLRGEEVDLARDPFDDDRGPGSDWSM
ncbi:hypothetical protein A3F55_00830 [Candidatus Adlerbacteria bacterium RIFCSPHIGHO2_12_FULL_53_18]|uniref:Uncharacterized protein n=1 Tax=Candidatus Adlerbacteria bacterium RIFCSPHIGHO2_12_FULL_53_18 TaxID=1797242 RepID=A0A1F4XTF9_9BACT|nr:MAG: hypothetical protein A3F55_00830 [Candidatus Adlerbacteria bacterium RIFCSPHIGHO2_12_FULL_53_18]